MVVGSLGGFLERAGVFGVVGWVFGFGIGIRLGFFYNYW